MSLVVVDGHIAIIDIANQLVPLIPALANVFNQSSFGRHMYARGSSILSYSVYSTVWISDQPETNVFAEALGIYLELMKG